MLHVVSGTALWPQGRPAAAVVDHEDDVGSQPALLAHGADVGSDLVVREDLRERRRERRAPVHRTPFHDLAHGHVPRFSYIVPIQCNDMYGTTGCNDDSTIIQNGDATVGVLVDAIRAAHAWTWGNNAIVITWDENDFSTDHPNGCCDADGSNPADGGGGGHVATIVITNHGPRGVQDSTPYNHYALLRTIQQAFGLGCLQYSCDVVNVKPMAPLFAVDEHGEDRAIPSATGA